MRVFNSNVEEIAKKRGPSKPVSPDEVVEIVDVYAPILVGMTTAMHDGQELNLVPNWNHLGISLQRHGKDDTYLALQDGEVSISLSFDDGESRKVREMIIRFLCGDLEGVANLLK